MEKKITKKQRLSLLKRVQKFQVTDNGVHKIGIACYVDEGGLWFVCNATVNEKYVWGYCYNWGDYEQNLKSIENFISCVLNNEQSVND